MKKLIFISLVAINSLFAIETTTVKKELVYSEKEYVGNVYSKEERGIGTRLLGYIKSIRVEEGDLIKKGDLLFEVDPSDIDSAITNAEANLMKSNSGLLMAELEFADAIKDYERYKNLYEKEVVPRRDFEKMELNMKMKKSQVELAKSMKSQAKANLKQAKAQIKYAKVKSPITGIVISKMKNTSEVVAPGSPVLLISSFDGMRVKTSVKESDIKYLKIGQEASVKIPALDKNVNAKIISIVPSADSTTHSYNVKFSLESRDGLTPGMYAKVFVKANKREAILIPFSSVIQRGGITGVFTKDNNRIKFVSVKVVNKLTGKVEVDGIKVGSEIILYPRSDLQDGQVIK